MFAQTFFLLSVILSIFMNFHTWCRHLCYPMDTCVDPWHRKIMNVDPLSRSMERCSASEGRGELLADSERRSHSCLIRILFEEALTPWFLLHCRQHLWDVLLCRGLFVQLRGPLSVCMNVCPCRVLCGTEHTMGLICSWQFPVHMTPKR